MATIRDLYDFIDQAETDRNYAPNTALGRKAALQLYEKYLNDEEKASVDVLESRLDRISQVVDSKARGLKTNTLLVYRRRIKNLIQDFRQYGTNAAARASWRSGKGAITQTNKVKKPVKKANLLEEIIELPEQQASRLFAGSLHDLNIQLRPDLRLTIPLPYDLSQKEAIRLKKLIDSMVLEVEDEETVI